MSGCANVPEDNADPFFDSSIEELCLSSFNDLQDGLDDADMVDWCLT